MGPAADACGKLADTRDEHTNLVITVMMMTGCSGLSDFTAAVSTSAHTKAPTQNENWNYF